MKKSLFVALAIACSLVASAAAPGKTAKTKRVAEPKFFVGGTIGLTHSSLKMTDEGESVTYAGTSVKIIPEFGYQFSKKFAVGISTGYIKGYSALGSFDLTDYKALGSAVVSTAADVASSKDAVGLNANAFRLAPYTRYTVASAGKFDFFIDGVLGMNFGKLKADMGGIDEKFTTIEVSLKPGVAFNASNHVQIIAKLGSVGYQNLSTEDYKLNRVGFDFDSGNLLLGACYRF